MRFMVLHDDHGLLLRDQFFQQLVVFFFDLIEGRMHLATHFGTHFSIGDDLQHSSCNDSEPVRLVELRFDLLDLLYYLWIGYALLTHNHHVALNSLQLLPKHL